MVEHVIINMNVVLSQIVPGLTIRIEKLGEMVFVNAKNRVKVQLMSFMQLLIVIYNRASITVAIDELDEGVFEYLLGELLHIISEKGKGQLLFI